LDEKTWCEILDASYDLAELPGINQLQEIFTTSSISPDKNKDYYQVINTADDDHITKHTNIIPIESW